jgi:hypothetical protein
MKLHQNNNQKNLLLKYALPVPTPVLTGSGSLGPSKKEISGS